ncbi:fatty acid-binding protein homolog 7-like [Aphomia sociella]
MNKFLGKKYVLCQSDNFDEYMDHLGAAFTIRKILMITKPVCCLSRNQDGTYGFTLGSSSSNFDVVFTPGEEFQDDDPQHKTTTTTIGFQKVVKRYFKVLQ